MTEKVGGIDGSPVPPEYPKSIPQYMKMRFETEESKLFKVQGNQLTQENLNQWLDTEDILLPPKGLLPEQRAVIGAYTNIIRANQEFTRGNPQRLMEVIMADIAYHSEQIGLVIAKGIGEEEQKELIQLGQESKQLGNFLEALSQQKLRKEKQQPAKKGGLKRNMSEGAQENSAELPQDGEETKVVDLSDIHTSVLKSPDNEENQDVGSMMQNGQEGNYSDEYVHDNRTVAIVSSSPVPPSQPGEEDLGAYPHISPSEFTSPNRIVSNPIVAPQPQTDDFFPLAVPHHDASIGNVSSSQSQQEGINKKSETPPDGQPSRLDRIRKKWNEIRGK